MKRSWLYAVSAGVALGFAVTRQRVSNARARGFASMDEQFHAAYDRVRQVKSRSSPALILFGDSIFLLNGDRRSEFAASAPATQVIMAAAHIPVGVFAALEQCSAGPLDEPAIRRLSAMQRARSEAQRQLEQLEDSTRADVERVLAASLAFIEGVLSRRRVESVELARFSAEMGPVLLRLTEGATQLELGALHAAVDAALSELSEEERRKVEVVVAGVHQARERSLGMQYFQKRFGEAPGDEKRVAFAEAAADVDEARELIGTRRLDRAIARAFFGDAHRLQRDVLGDAATHLLEHTELSEIVGDSDS